MSLNAEARRLSEEETNARLSLVLNEGALDGGSPDDISDRIRDSSEIVVPPGNHRVEIRYTAINLTSHDKSRFRYRLG